MSKVNATRMCIGLMAAVGSAIAEEAMSKDSMTKPGMQGTKSREPGFSVVPATAPAARRVAARLARPPLPGCR